MKTAIKLERLRHRLEEYYTKGDLVLPFHGWHHITFVAQKATEFSDFINADLFLVESAALVHDLNYFVQKASGPETGMELAGEFLIDAGYTGEEIHTIMQIVLEADISKRSAEISKEAQSLSDADTLFKALPVTPVLFASKYLAENNIDIRSLAQEIVTDQNRLMEAGEYFYTEVANRRYLEWAKINLSLWNEILAALSDPEISNLVEHAKKLGVI